MSFIPGVWIGYWSVLFLGYDDAFYAGILALFVGVEIICYFTGSYIGIWHSRKAGEALHESYVDRLAHAMVSFYDQTPIGRIMNRLAKDTDVAQPVRGQPSSDVLENRREAAAKGSTHL